MVNSVTLDDDQVDSLVSTRLFNDYGNLINFSIETIDEAIDVLEAGQANSDWISDVMDHLESAVAKLDAIEVLYSYYDDTGVELDGRDALDAAIVELTEAIQEETNRLMCEAFTEAFCKLYDTYWV